MIRAGQRGGTRANVVALMGNPAIEMRMFGYFEQDDPLVLDGHQRTGLFECI